MTDDNKELDVSSAEAEEVQNFEDALGAELANEFESTETVETDAADKDDAADDTDTDDDSQEEVDKEEVEEKSTEVVEKKTEEKVTEPEKKVVLPEAIDKYPDLKDGDFVKNEDGSFEVRDKVLAADIESVLEDDAGIYLRIFKAKPAKANAMAEIMGFKGDSTITPGRQMANVVKTLQKGDEQVNADLLKTYFPYLVDRNEDAPFGFSDAAQADQAADAKVAISETASDPLKYSDTDLQNAKFRVVAESEGKILMEDIKIEDLTEQLEKFKFDPSTGKAMDIYARLELAVKDVHADKYADGSDKPTRKTPVGGHRKRGTRDTEAKDPAVDSFTAALTSQMGDLN